MAGYQPRPIDTSGVSLGPDLAPIIERLAESAHEVWAERRLAEGWRYGESRNDATKVHPCLVPYTRLPETEKAYDRALVEQALKGIIALGWTIEKRGSDEGAL